MYMQGHGFRMCFCMRHVGCCAHLVFLIHLNKSYQVPRHMGLVTKYSQLLLCTPPVLGLNMSQQSPKSHADFPGKHPQRIGANFSPINTLPKKGPVQTTWCQFSKTMAGRRGIALLGSLLLVLTFCFQRTLVSLGCKVLLANQAKEHIHGTDAVIFEGNICL